MTHSVKFPPAYRLILLGLLALQSATALSGPGHHAWEAWCDTSVDCEQAAPSHDDSGSEIRSQKDCAACDFFAQAAMGVSIKEIPVEPAQTSSIQSPGRSHHFSPTHHDASPRGPPASG